MEVMVALEVIHMEKIMDKVSINKKNNMGMQITINNLIMNSRN